ncbi:hypothetical protein HK102_013214 [Quaeritorhiza haematococci]|nr:hypothetical protein HK102_013214 [Quaeritorhiza haematococci]
MTTSPSSLVTAPILSAVSAPSTFSNGSFQAGLGTAQYTPLSVKAQAASDTVTSPVEPDVPKSKRPRKSRTVSFSRFARIHEAYSAEEYDRTPVIVQKDGDS